MVFARIRGTPFDPPGDPASVADPAATRPPGRGDGVIRPPSGSGTGLTWRAIVRAHDRDAVETEWHLAACLAPHEIGAHCPEGQRLIETGGQPDGHCVVAGRCARCDGNH